MPTIFSKLWNSWQWPHQGTGRRVYDSQPRPELTDDQVREEAADRYPREFWNTPETEAELFRAIRENKVEQPGGGPWTVPLAPRAIEAERHRDIFWLVGLLDWFWQCADFVDESLPKNERMRAVIELFVLLPGVLLGFILLMALFAVLVFFLFPVCLWLFVYYVILRRTYFTFAASARVFLPEPCEPYFGRNVPVRPKARNIWEFSAHWVDERRCSEEGDEHL